MTDLANIGTNENKKPKQTQFVDDEEMGIPKGAVKEKTSFSQRNFLIGSAKNKHSNEINNIFKNMANEQTSNDVTSGRKDLSATAKLLHTQEVR